MSVEVPVIESARPFLSEHETSPENPPPSLKYSRIQVLRFIAATAVVLFHALGTAGRYFTKPSSFEFAGHADRGVDLFFVVSGFIMVVTVATRETHWRIFLTRRIERVVPLYWCATLLMVGLLAVPNMSSTPLPDLLFLAKSLALLCWTTNEFPLVYPGWTIEFEMFFYLVISVSMGLTRATWKAAIFALVSCVLFGAVMRSLQYDMPGLKLLGSPLLLEFGLGIVVGHLVINKPLQPFMVIALALGFVGIVLGRWDEHVPRVLIAGIGSAVIVFIAAALDRRSSLRSGFSHLLVKLGDSSYAIYVVHSFVVSIGCKLLQKLWPETPIDLAIVGTTIATLVVAWIVHVYVERPLARSLRRAEPTFTR